MRIRAQGNSPTIYCVVLSILTVKKEQFLGSELHYKHPTEGEYIYQEITRARSFELLACENAALGSMHVLFVQEHNRVAQNTRNLKNKLTLLRLAKKKKKKLHGVGFEPPTI